MINTIINLIITKEFALSTTNPGPSDHRVRRIYKREGLSSVWAIETKYNVATIVEVSSMVGSWLVEALGDDVPV